MTALPTVRASTSNSFCATASRRSYSMANAPHLGPSMELHIRHMPGGKFTDHVFGAMKEKEILRIEGPFGSFFLREDSDKAHHPAGLGHRICAHQGPDGAHAAPRVTRPVHAVLGWSPSSRPVHARLGSAHSCKPCRSLRYVPVVSDRHPRMHGLAAPGFVHHAVMDDFPDLSGHQVYACGAPIVVESARRDFCALAGTPARRIFC